MCVSSVWRLACTSSGVRTPSSWKRDSVKGPETRLTVFTMVSLSVVRTESKKDMVEMREELRVGIGPRSRGESEGAMVRAMRGSQANDG